MNSTTGTTAYFNYGDTESKKIIVKCISCGKEKEIKWVEQRWPYVSSGSGLETINTYIKELNRAGFMYLVGNKTYFFHQKCFKRIIK